MSETPMTSRERRQALQALLDEPAQTVEAIRSGQVDAFVISEQGDEDRVYVLQSADRLYRLIVETMGEGAVTLSHEGAITYCNAHFQTLIDRSRDELLGRALRDCISEDTRGVFDALLKSSEHANTRAEIEFETAAGATPVAVASTVLHDFDGSQYCLIVNDLSDQRAREQLRAAKEAAEMANRAKDDFLAMVSHELRSPITVILGWTRMLQMNRVDRDTLSLAVDSIHHSTARLLKLVDDILDASRLNSGKVKLEMQPTDVRRAVRESLDVFRFDVEQKALHVSVQMPEEPVVVRGDADRLQQVVVNLLANAVKFTPPHGHIDLELRAADGVAILDVRDSGEGIDPSFIGYVFERFRQDDTSTTRSHKGLGLGLAIVKQLVDAHAGVVSVFSGGKGTGATFTVALPLTDEQQQPIDADIDEPLPSLESTRVLLVDDEPETVNVMRTILASAGAVVEAATSVAHALELAAVFEPHVIVSDIAMPREDGFQFLRRLSAREAAPSVPVLAITGKSTPGDRDAILAAGFQRYLRKPFEPEELIRAVHVLARPDHESA